jgi:hypothetical protein
MQPARAWHRSQHSCCVDACTRGQSTPSFQSKPALNVHFAGGGGTGCFGLSAVQEAPLPVTSDKNASPATVQSPNHFCRELQPGATRRSNARGAWQADSGCALGWSARVGTAAGAATETRKAHSRAHCLNLNSYIVVDCVHSTKCPSDSATFKLDQQ